jgi:predicted nucleic acid-binding protein
MVLVDTPVWSLAFRRKRQDLGPHDQRVLDEWKQLINDGRAQLAGIIRQEILSGIRSERQFDLLESQLTSFPDALAAAEDHVCAARFYNRCRENGITASHSDMLICAISYRLSCPIFTTDSDFLRYARVLPIRLHGMTPRAVQ